MTVADANPMGSQTLLRDVARVAGLSVSGTSRALNGDPRMAAATRERVRRLAAAMGYEPVAAARALKSFGGREVAFRGTIGWLVRPHEWRIRHGNEIGGRHAWILEIERRALTHGYSVDCLQISETDGRALARVLRARGIRGVIISGCHDDHRELRLPWSELCALSLSPMPAIRFLNSLSVPYFHDTGFAVQTLHRRGYRRIGFVMVGNVLPEFLAGYQFAVHTEGLPEIRPLISDGGVPGELARWVTRFKVDCILTTTGVELISALTSTGLRVPEDIGVCCVDDFDAPGILSGLHQPRAKLAALAVDMLHSMLQRNETGVPEDPVEVHLPSAWSEGKTLRQAPEGFQLPLNRRYFHPPGSAPARGA